MAKVSCVAMATICPTTHRGSVIRRNLSAVFCVVAFFCLVYCSYQYRYSVQEEPLDPSHLLPPTLQGPRHNSYDQGQEPINIKTIDKPAEKYDFREGILPEKNKTKSTSPSEEVTIVTMYLNIGQFQKGESSFNTFYPQLYKRWMKTFSAIKNPVVAFFDNSRDLVYFESMRRKIDPTLVLTRTFRIQRSQLWAFSLRDEIAKIYKKPGYPKHHPNTVVPEYSCAMHAKYEVMSIATKANFFNTRYFAWLDIGLFRSIAVSDSSPPPMHIWLPPEFNKSTVAYTEVYQREPTISTQAIIRSNQVWVCGCFFIGEGSVMRKWAEQYIHATKALLKNFQLMNTDQQILYILFNSGRPKISMQLYKTQSSKYDSWFFLGYLCRDAGDIHNTGGNESVLESKYTTKLDHGNKIQFTI